MKVQCLLGTASRRPALARLVGGSGFFLQIPPNTGFANSGGKVWKAQTRNWKTFFPPFLLKGLIDFTGV